MYRGDPAHLFKNETFGYRQSRIYRRSMPKQKITNKLDDYMLLM